MIEIMKQRHSVRQYEDKKIDEERRKILNELVAKINEDSGLNFQICFDEPEAFDTFLAHYGKFQGVQNYVVLVGKKGQDEMK